jgi:hypothetical protein
VDAVLTIRTTLARIPRAVAYLAFGALLIGLHASLELGSQAQALTAPRRWIRRCAG